MTHRDTREDRSPHRSDRSTGRVLGKVDLGRSGAGFWRATKAWALRVSAVFCGLERGCLLGSREGVPIGRAGKPRGCHGCWVAGDFSKVPKA